MFYKIEDWVIGSKIIDGNEKLILSIIMTHCALNKTSVLSYERLSKQMAISKSTAQRLLKKLEDKNCIKKGKTFNLGTHYTVSENLKSILEGGSQNDYRVPKIGTAGVPKIGTGGSQDRYSSMVPKIGTQKDKEKEKNKKEEKHLSSREDSSPSDKVKSTVPTEQKLENLSPSEYQELINSLDF